MRCMIMLLFYLFVVSSHAADEQTIAIVASDQEIVGTLAVPTALPEAESAPVILKRFVFDVN